MSLALSKLEAKSRTGAGKGYARRTRAEGLIPACVYGKHLDKPLNIALDAKIAAVEEHLARIERKIDDLNNDTRMMMKALGRLEAGKTGK